VAATPRLLFIASMAYPVANCGRSGLRSSGSVRRLRLVGTFSRSPLPMQGSSVAGAVSVNRSPESWIVCLIKLSVAIEPGKPRF
jgi:hypothetical protein